MNSVISRVRQARQFLLSNTLMEIRRDFEKRHRRHGLENLSTFLPGGRSGMSLETASGTLGIEPATLTTWVHRLRGRFRQRWRASVARTVPAPHEVDEELTYLRNLLAHDIRNSS